VNIAKRIIKFLDIYYGRIIVAIALVFMGFWLGIHADLFSFPDYDLVD
jgi:small basic protein